MNGNLDVGNLRKPIRIYCTHKISVISHKTFLKYPDIRVSFYAKARTFSEHTKRKAVFGGCLMVKNRFNGIINHSNGNPISDKTNGDLELPNIKTVAVNYGGDSFTEWDADTFTAYVTVRLQHRTFII